MSFAPVQIDLGSVGGLSPAPVANGNFGCGVAFSGNGLVMVVGEPGVSTGTGTVHTYDWSGSSWVKRTTSLVAYDGAANDAYGLTVALNEDGTLLVVGAYVWEGSVTDRGAVYTYYCSTWTLGSVWTPVTAYNATPLISVDTPAASDGFGVSVALNKDASILAVGAYGWEGSLNDQGAIYIYVRSGSGASTTWAMQNGATSPQIIAADAAVSDRLSRVAISGDGLVIAAGVEFWEGSNTDQGAVYIFDYSTTTSTWSQRGAILTVPNNQGSSGFGQGVGLNYDGTKLLVGAIHYDATYLAQGVVFYYVRDGSGWTLQNDTYFAHSTPQANEVFGTKTAFIGEGAFAAVGSLLYSATYSGQGRVTFFQMEDGAMPGGWNKDVSVPKALVAGTGGMFRSMEGAITLPAVTLVASGSPTLYGAAALTLPTVTVTSTATTGCTGTTGASALPAVTAAGAGGLYGGEIALPTVTLSATMYVGLMATAAMQLPRVTASGASTVTALASGSIVLPKVSAAAAVLLGGIGSGAGTLKKVRMAGAGSFGAQGLCALVLPAVTTQGVGFQGLTGTGSTRLRKIQVKGMKL